MASPQIEDGHIDIANTIADKFCSYRLSGQEWQIVWVILRKTWGWLENPKNKKGGKKKMDLIALSQFSKLTGIDRRKCHAILKKLIAKNIILKVITNISDGSLISYGFQKDFDTWALSPKKATLVTQKGDTVTQKALSPKKVTNCHPKRQQYCHPKRHTQKIVKKKKKPTKFLTLWISSLIISLKQKNTRHPKKPRH